MAKKQTMKDVSHTSPHTSEDVRTVWHRGGERVPPSPDTHDPVDDEEEEEEE